EGVAAGTAGALIALVLLGLGKTVARSQFPAWIPTIALHGVAFGQVFWLVLLGITVGALGSAVAGRRFLEVSSARRGGLGQPVTEAGGNVARISAPIVTSARRTPSTVLTMW